jgi:hypothetical protein
MDDAIRHALETERVIDITTTGRMSGRPHRIETWFHNVDGRLYLTGQPGPRGWYANLRANPRLVFHLKQSVQADLPATARPIVEEGEKRDVLSRILARLDRGDRVDEWVARSPLVEVELD